MAGPYIETNSAAYEYSKLAISTMRSLMSKHRGVRVGGMEIRPEVTSIAELFRVYYKRNAVRD